ncbi:Bgt-20997 [Blumeria graminis f. sp. tritici]|uniref:Bgt-20997 n=2 Tax=Blumeria graminis f. sp. tritici TaxID=62690 RepID=A0A381L4V6_BLUGR|nr:Bgt-20997 [Blumeria graminis f. sp. tritici]
MLGSAPSRRSPSTKTFLTSFWDFWLSCGTNRGRGETLPSIFRPATPDWSASWNASNE